MPNLAKVSIVVPTFNEAALIESFLRQLHQRAAEAEIVVADGGSSDGTAELATALCHRVVRARRGRAAQMNAGGRAAHGEILWFLHVDVTVPTQCLNEIEKIMSTPGVAGGFFRIRLPRSQPIYRLTDGFAHYAGLLLRMRCGDHGMFCRRSLFVEVGGFPEVPLMEDVEFFRRLRRCGRVRHSRRRIVVSPRRYETIGPARLTFAYGRIATLYLFGASFPTLAAMYRRSCCDARDRNT